MNTLKFATLLLNDKKFKKYFDRQFKDDWVQEFWNKDPYQTVIGMWVLMLYESYGMPPEITMEEINKLR